MAPTLLMSRMELRSNVMDWIIITIGKDKTCSPFDSQGELLPDGGDYPCYL